MSDSEVKSSNVLSLKEDDVAKMLVAATHLGAENLNFQMKQYVFKRRADGVNIINLGKTWEKLLLAARAIVAIENVHDVFVISSRPTGQRAILKFAKYVGATPIAGRFTPGMFSNHTLNVFREPHLLVVTDPLADQQAICESAFANIPVIALCDTDNWLRYIDIAIPCNNKSVRSIGLMWWLLAREVLRLRNSISRTIDWPVIADMFFYCEPEDLIKEEQQEEQEQQEYVQKTLPEAEYEEPHVYDNVIIQETNDWGDEEVQKTVPQTETVEPYVVNDNATCEVASWVAEVKLAEAAAASSYTYPTEDACEGQDWNNSENPDWEQ